MNCDGDKSYINSRHDELWSDSAVWHEMSTNLGDLLIFFILFIELKFIESP